MIRPSDETYSPYQLDRLYDYEGPFKKAIPVAEHYGFRLVKPIQSTEASTDIIAQNSSDVAHSPAFEERFSALEHYVTNQDKFSTPALLCHTKKAKNKQGYFNLDVYGVADSFVETLLLKSAYEILKKEGYKNLLVEINSFGSEESYARFGTEVQKFVKKHLHKFDSECQELLKESPVYIYKIAGFLGDSLTTVQEDILLHKPRPVAHLSESCRIHLKELLEHLEETEMPYVLNPGLFPQSGKHAETVYTIIDQDSGKTVAYGERFSTQAKTFTHKMLEAAGQEIHCAAITINLVGGKKEKYSKYDDQNDACKIYFAHSGAIAKRNTLKVLKLLQEAKLQCKHAVIKNTLREQLYHAERSGFPITVILGVKEVQEGNIIVRNNLANRQKAIPISRLCSYLKRNLKSI